MKPMFNILQYNIYKIEYKMDMKRSKTENMKLNHKKYNNNRTNTAKTRRLQSVSVKWNLVTFYYSFLSL